MMARLTADMTRLVGEIQAGHGEREHMMQRLRQATADLQHAVGRMQIGFRTARADMRQHQQRTLREFMVGLQGTVGALRGAHRSDLAGARAAWMGQARSERTAPKAEQRRRRS